MEKKITEKDLKKKDLPRLCDEERENRVLKRVPDAEIHCWQNGGRK